MTHPTKLKPCPFCGHPPHIYGAQIVIDGGVHESIDCANPDCPMEVTTGYLPFDEAVQAWNTRADLVPAMLAAERAAVIEAALQELGYAAWRHEGDDSYSIGLEAGARRQSQADFDAIRALSDDAVTAARARIEAEGYRRGLEAAAALVETHVYTTNGDQRQMEPRAHAKDDMHHRTIAAAIRALIGGDDD